MASQASTPLSALRMRRRPGLTAPFGVLLVCVILFWLAENFYKTPADFYANLIFGATNGLMYGLIAIGYTLVYGILELINFAHGDVFMLGGMLTATLVTSLTLAAGSAWYVLWPGILLLLVAAAAFCATLNASIERVAYRRLRNAPRLAPLITAIGMSFILQNVGLIWKGARPVSVDSILPTSAIFTIGGVS
jgi:branched-chain amino acid transport system permease protein